jgi:hypothetical protein
MVLSGAAHTPAREDPLTPNRYHVADAPVTFWLHLQYPRTAFPQVTGPFQVTRRRKLGLAEGEIVERKPYDAVYESGRPADRGEARPVA